MKDKTACFTGHRDIPPLKRPGIKHRLEREIEKSIQAGYVYFGAGGALGFDTLAAQTVLKLKGRYQDIKLILVLPCVSPTFSGTFTSIPLDNWSAPKLDVSGLLLICTLPSTKLVPSGIVSFISTSFAKPPSFLTVIVYVIFSPSTTYPKPFSVVDSFSAEIIGFTNVCVVVSVGFPSTVAVFLISALSSWSFTVTLNSTVFVSPAAKSTEIPLARVSSVSAVV